MKMTRKEKKALKRARQAAAFSGGGWTSIPSVRTPLPERQADEPVRATKRSRLAVDQDTGQFTFAALYSQAPYGVEARAECTMAMRFAVEHHAPEPLCQCGFYAYKPSHGALSELFLFPMAVALDVELSGRVIVHEYGYRAEHQRVMRATLLQFRCTHPIPQRDVKVDDGGDRVVIIGTTTTGAWASTDSPYLPLCNERAVAVRTREALRTTYAWDRGGTSTFCADHAGALPATCRDEIEFDVLDRLRTDLPTDWVLP